MTLLNPDGKQERPPTARAREALAGLRLTPAPLQYAVVRSMLAELRRQRTNGGALFARFHLEEHPDLDWFVSRNLFNEIGFFEWLLGHPSLRSELPELRIPEPVTVPNLTHLSAFTFDGELARVLVVGGAYEAFRGTPGAAKRLAGRFVSALLGERFLEVEVFRTHERWTPWFHGYPPDDTWIGIDKRERAVWLLCLTDVD